MKMVNFELEDPSPATPRRVLHYSEKDDYTETESSDIPQPTPIRVLSPKKEKRSHSLQRMYKC